MSESHCNAMGKEEFISIPHFINPQLFWYHKVNGQNAFVELQRIEESLQNLFSEKQSAAPRPHRPCVGETVAIAFVSWNKFIRARVEYVAKYVKGDDEYVVWAVDYGFPFQTKLCHIRKLPLAFTEPTDHIRVGGIANVIPAELDFDFVTTTSRLVCKQSWSQRAVELVEKIINDAASISFIESFCDDKVSPKQYFGDLKIINHSGDEFFVSDYLTKLNYSIKCVDNFHNKLATLQTTKIPCWQTNSKDIKIIENKLNTLNVHYAHHGKFDLSGSFSESSCDNFSKQKVMDWCERNQNLNNNSDAGRDALGPTSALDATDISFDDSVSVKKFKGRNATNDETVMGYAGALHESRRKKYEGKGLPPKPTPELFEVIPEQNNRKHDEKDGSNKSGDSSASVLSQRAKALMDLRKKHEEVAKGKANEDIPYDEMGKLSISSQSEAGTEEFLETCKKKNAQSARLERLKELRKRRVEDASSHKDSHSGAEMTSDAGLVEDDRGSASTTSTRLLKLKKIKEKHSKQNVNELEHKVEPRDVPTWNSDADIESQTESRISAHAAKLISMRKKIKEKYSQGESTIPAVKNLKQGYKMPQQSPKFTKLDFSKTSHEYVETPLGQPQETCPPPVKNDNTNSRMSLARENELRNLRKNIQENPFHNMKMVPAGYDLTKLVIRNNEDQHWHTKQSTLNDPLHLNLSVEEEFQNQAGRNNSSRKQLIPRRTEHVEEQNFRLTRSRKERKKDEVDSPEDKHLLDLSVSDVGCVPAMKPLVVAEKRSKELNDLLIFSEREDLESTAEDTKIEKLIDLSVNSDVPEEADVSASASSDSFVKFVKERNSVRDTSREKLLETSYITSDGSVDFVTPESPTKALSEDLNTVKVTTSCEESSSSISSGSFTKLESTKLESTRHNSEACNEQFKKTSKHSVGGYEASSSSDSSGSVGKIEIVNNALPRLMSPITDPIVESSSSSSLGASGPLVASTVQFDELQSGEVKKASSKTDFALNSDITVKANQQMNKFPSNLLKNPKSLSSSSSGTPFVTPTHVIKKDKCPSSLLEPRSSSSSSTLIKPHSPLKQILSGSDRSLVTTSDSTIRLNETPTRLPEISGEASLKTNFVQHLVMAHSNVKVTPIERMSNALFSPEIHQEMENMRLTKMYRIQSYAWAHLVRGNSFFVINTSRTGKTWCYLPPLCSMVSFRLETQGVPETFGPVAVVIAPSSAQVESITRQCRRLLTSAKTKISVVPSYAFRNADEVKIELHNGCGILVITPPSLQRLLVANERESLLNTERIQYVVVDDLDTMMNQDEDFNATLHKFIRPIVHHRENGKVPFQIVVTSRKWSRRLIHLLRISNQPLLCIADYLEAAVYAKSKLSIKLQSSSEKMNVLLRFLEKCPYGLERVVIICSSYDEVDEVEKNLFEAGYTCLAYTDRMSPEVSNLVTEWRTKIICHHILITIDRVLPELMIQNVWTAIHYSLPTSWTKFNFRFSVFLQNYENLLTTDFETPAKVPKSLILLDENNNLQLPRLIEFMKHHNQLKHIHQDILTVAAKAIAELEESRVDKGIPMCPNILEFGSCDENNKCLQRHQLTKYDGPIEGIPTRGEVRLKILDVVSPTHYTARLLTHKNGETWELVRRSNEFTHFLMELSLYFMNDDYQTIHWPLRVNDICVVKGDNIFHRCRVVEVPPVLHENFVKLINVKVKLIDSGSSFMCKSHDIFVIPEKFKDFPPQAVDIRLTGVVPFDNEQTWDSRSTRTVNKWIMTDVTDKDCLQATINFALMDTIWVNNVFLLEKLDAIHGYAMKINVRRSLLGKNFALPDDRMHSVKQTALENGLLDDTSEITKQGETAEKLEEEQNLLEFSTSSSAEEKNESETKVVPSSVKKTSIPMVSKQDTEEWERLEIDELLQVKVAQLHDPSKFYVYLLKKEEDRKELDDFIRSEKKILLEDPHPMQNCLAPRDGRYYRAKIQRLIIDSAEGCVQARVFFCDLGIFANYPVEQLRSSSKFLTDYLPFQAICCKLTGIRVESVGEEIQNILQSEDSVRFAYVVKEIVDADGCDEGFYIRNYEIILYECLTGKKDIQINKLLVDSGLASYDDETKHFLQLESKVDFSNFEYEHGETETYDFQAFLDRVQKMDEEDAEDEQKMRNSPFKSIKEDEEPKIVEITSDSPVEVTNALLPKTDSLLPTLRALHKRPRTTWYETMCVIYLVINAPDITDYHLEVTPNRLIFVALVNGEQHVLILDFLGYVEPDMVTHEIRGLNVVVRLVKSVYMEWPRLLQDPTKVSWLTYNFNAIDAMDAERLIDGRHSRPKKRMASCSSEYDSDTSHSNPCETFTPIVNVDEIHDPMQEFY